MTRILVASWAGSRNLGDELLLGVTLDILRKRAVEPVVVSVDPARTSREFDVEAVHHLNLRRAFESVRGMVFGGGGLLQDETSAWNLPYHLARIAMADRRNLPWVGIGLGADGLTTFRGRRRVQKALTSHLEIVVRDVASQSALEALDVPRVVLGADLAWLLDPPPPAPADFVNVTLRLPQSARWLPGALVRPARRDPRWVRAMAGALDETARRMGCTIRFVAFEARSDDVLHRQVAEHLTVPFELVSPTRDELLAVMASARACVSMRYHGIVTSALAGVPGVAMTFSPKLAAIADDLGLASLDANRPEDLPGLMPPTAGDLAARVAELRTRATTSERAIDRLLASL